MLFLVMGLISLVDEIQFMLISSHHSCIRSITYNRFVTGRGFLLSNIWANNLAAFYTMMVKVLASVSLLSTGFV